MVHLRNKIYVQGDVHHHCAQFDRSVNALQLCRVKFSHEETFQQTFFEKNPFLDRNKGISIGVSVLYGVSQFGTEFQVEGDVPNLPFVHYWTG